MNWKKLLFITDICLKNKLSININLLFTGYLFIETYKNGFDIILRIFLFYNKFSIKSYLLTVQIRNYLLENICFETINIFKKNLQREKKIIEEIFVFYFLLNKFCHSVAVGKTGDKCETVTNERSRFYDKINQINVQASVNR